MNIPVLAGCFQQDLLIPQHVVRIPTRFCKSHSTEDKFKAYSRLNFLTLPLLLRFLQRPKSRFQNPPYNPLAIVRIVHINHRALLEPRTQGGNHFGRKHVQNSHPQLPAHRNGEQGFAQVKGFGGRFETGAADHTAAGCHAFDKAIVVDRQHVDIVDLVWAGAFR